MDQLHINGIFEYYVDTVHHITITYIINTHREKDMIFCKNCGKELATDAVKFCNYCGLSVNDSSSVATSTFNASSMREGSIQRPTGVSILSILFIISGILSIIGIGIVSIIIGWGMWKGRSWAWTGFIILTLLGTVGSIISILILLFSPPQQQLVSNDVIYVIIGPIIGIGLSVLLLYYIYRPHVKAYFDKS